MENSKTPALIPEGEIRWNDCFETLIKMGEIAEMMMDGTLCQTCGVYIESKKPAFGVPRFCWECMPEDIKKRIQGSKNKNKLGTEKPNKTEYGINNRRKQRNKL